MRLRAQIGPHEHTYVEDMPVCAYRGPETGRLVECPSCAGRVQLKLLACQKHGSCVPGPQKALGAACCHGCKEYAPTDDGWIRVNHGAGGLGDALLGLCCVAGLREATGRKVLYKCHPDVLPFLLLFQGAYDGLAAHTHEYTMRDHPETVLPGDRQMNAHFLIEFEERHKVIRWERYCRNINSPGPIIPPLRDRAKLEALGKQWQGAIVLAPFSTWPNREYHPQAWLALEKALLASGHHPVVIDSRQDRASIFTSEKLLGAPAQTVAALMLNAVCVCGGDSGPAHLSGILGVPTIVLCGQTTGPSIYGAYPNVRCLQSDWPCSGCWWRGPYNDERCSKTCGSINAIGTAAIMTEVERAERKAHA